MSKVEGKGAGTLTLTNGTLNNNRACIDTVLGTCEDGRGGAIFNNGGTVNITNTLISNNTADGGFNSLGGGGIYNANGGTVNITNSTLANNVDSVDDAGAAFTTASLRYKIPSLAVTV